MTKKDYILLADALAQSRPLPQWDAPLHRQWRADVRYIASALRTTNPRFDADKFIAACERDHLEGKVR